MEYEQDDSSEMLTPKMIREQLKSHDKRMRDGREGFALAKACYTTSYWDYIQGAKVATETSKLTDVNVEVCQPMAILQQDPPPGDVRSTSGTAVSWVCCQGGFLPWPWQSA